MKFKMLGTLKYQGKKYDITDCNGMYNPEAFGLENFYGGRVKRLGKTEVDRLYMCLEGSKVIDLILFEEMFDKPEQKDKMEDVDRQEPEPTISGVNEASLLSGDISKDDKQPDFKPVEVKAKSLPRKGSKNTSKKGGK